MEGPVCRLAPNDSRWERGTLMACAGAESTVSHARRGTADFGGRNDGEGFRARDV